ncbi:MAG: hypothetical protein DRJ45_01735 [Thermoprotei archaeon]|nr:MAG: hypothetical protein DRJ45_01735 [Thermoprotei archaeon]
MNRLEKIARKSVKGGFYLLSGNIISLILMALASIIIARLLGPEKYGLYALVFVGPSIITSIINLGLPSAITRYTSLYRSENKLGKALEIANIGLKFRFIMSLTGFTLSILLSDIFALMINRPDASLYIKVASIIILGNMIFTIIQNIYLGFDEMKYASINMVIRATTKFILTPILILIGFQLLGAIIGHISSYIVAAIIGILIVYQKILSINNNEKMKFIDGLKIMLSYSLPLYFSTLINSMIMQYNNIVQSWFASNFQIGNFKVAVNFLSLLTVLTTPISLTLFPAFSKFNIDKDKNELIEFLKYSIKYTSMILMPATILVMFLSREIVYIIYGSSYTLSPLYLTMYGVGYLYISILIVLSSFLNGVGKTKTILWGNILGIIMTIPLTYILGYLYNIIGIIISILIVNLSICIYYAHIVKTKYGMEIDFKTILKIFSTALVSAIPIIFIKNYISNTILTLILCGAIYLSIYLTMIPIAKIVDKKDLRRIRTLTRDIKIIYPIIQKTLKYEEIVIGKLG